MKRKPVKGYKKLYFVTKKGDVCNQYKKLKPWVINSGYLAVKLTKNGKRKHYLVHRLIAQTFIDNPENKNEVNHIDGNKLNNKVSNLEWVTSSENKQHALAKGMYDKIYTMRNTLGKKHKSTASKYHNVGWDKDRQKWKGGVRHQGKTYYQKRFDTEEKAALHVNWILNKLKLTDRPKNVIS